MTFWTTARWHDYEAACGHERGTRQQLLAAAPWQTRVVDLTQSKVMLWRHIRKSYHSLIHGANRRYDVKVLSGIGSPGLIHTCKRVHVIDRGRQTRPDVTWDLMGDWAEDGIGFMAMAFDRQLPVEEMGDWPPCVSFTYFVSWDRWAYYFSAATLRPNVNHALIWAAMQTLQSHGVERVELGWHGEAQDEKGRNIEFFKSGFGGTLVPVAEGACVSLR